MPTTFILQGAKPPLSSEPRDAPASHTKKLGSIHLQTKNPPQKILSRTLFATTAKTISRAWLKDSDPLCQYEAPLTHTDEHFLRHQTMRLKENWSWWVRAFEEEFATDNAATCHGCLVSLFSTFFI